MQLLLYVLAGITVLYIIVQWVRIIYYGRVSDRLIAKAVVVDNYPDDPDRRILIIGDSLWVGVGASDSADSLAGRLIEDLPDAQVINQAQSGARISDGLAQLEAAAAEHGAFHQIIIQLGANDIVNFTPLARATRDLQVLLKRASELAPDVAYMVSGSVGFAPVFWRPLDWFYTAVSRRYLKAFSAVSRAVGVLYIDFFRERKVDPFYGQPEKFYAADKFHPSGAGYGLWYERCQENLQCFAYDQKQPQTIEEIT
jgi:lysophospholipase L1-like esterase